MGDDLKVLDAKRCQLALRNGNLTNAVGPARQKFGRSRRDPASHNANSADHRRLLQGAFHPRGRFRNIALDTFEWAGQLVLQADEDGEIDLRGFDHRGFGWLSL
ncbi:hypothetical protein ACMA5I_06485 [Paracoccaceae bacterium GXU_MW_L88]